MFEGGGGREGWHGVFTADQWSNPPRPLVCGWVGGLEETKGTMGAEFAWCIGCVIGTQFICHFISIFFIFIFLCFIFMFL